MTVVHVPSPLFSYTGNRTDVSATGSTLGEILLDLDRQYPGIRFRVVDEQDRIRPTILFYVGGTMVRTLPSPVGTGEDVHIIAALSGG